MSDLSMLYSLFTHKALREKHRKTSFNQRFLIFFILLRSPVIFVFAGCLASRFRVRFYKKSYIPTFLETHSGFV